jgi:hypothetical protein
MTGRRAPVADRQVGWFAAPRLVRQDSEGYGFLGIHVDAVVRRGGQRHSGQEGRQVRQDLRIVRAASGDDQFVGREGRCRHGDRGGGEHRGGGDQVGERQAGLIRRATNSAPYCSRPALLGGLRR